ncbi:STAS domain-containing protein [Planomonospora parontospora]|uniref:STAS domain-containing protein n=1 Tax=Planomonospora parontospora TaxID=58119 RepID=UPI0019515822|nr:STAS domain-containing protein [Planomonospora parontospora]
MLTGLRGAVVIVRPTGELTMSTAPYFRTRLEQAAVFNTPPRVVVDTEEITFCDSAGLDVLTAVLHEIERGGGRLVLSGRNDRLLRILKTTGMDGRLQPYATTEDAVSHLAAFE